MKKFVRRQTSERLKTLQAEVRHAARKPRDPDSIHDLRVSIRRLRQELRVFEGWFEADRVKSIRERLKKLMARCGAVRNCDIAMEVLEAAGFEDRTLANALGEKRLRAQKDLARTLQAWRRKHRTRQWRKNMEITEGDRRLGNSAEERARVILPGMVDELFRAGREAAKPGSSHRQLHQFRLVAKRVRYSLELFAPSYGTKLEPIMKSLRTLQEKLGAINDCAATLEMLRQNRAASAAVRRLAGEREADFRAYWKRSFGPRVSAQWKAVLRGTSKKRG